MGDFLDIHAAFSAGHQDGDACSPVENDRDVELLDGFGVGLNDERLDGLAFGAGLLGDERVGEHRGGEGFCLLACGGVLHPAQLIRVAFELARPATAGVNLSLHHRARAAEFVERSSGFVRRRHHDMSGDIRPGGGEQILGLILVNLHVRGFRVYRCGLLYGRRLTTERGPTMIHSTPAALVVQCGHTPQEGLR